MYGHQNKPYEILKTGFHPTRSPTSIPGDLPSPDLLADQLLGLFLPERAAAPGSISFQTFILVVYKWLGFRV